MPGPLTRQAQNEALVRFGPQRFALRELIAQLVATRDQGIRAARGSAAGMTAAINAARGETGKVYDTAEQSAKGSQAMVSEALAGLGAAASPFAAAIAREQGGAQTRMAESEANSLQELTKRNLEAQAGREFAVRNVLNTFSGGLDKVHRSYEELAREEGAFTQGRVGELKKEAADRAFQRDLAEFTQSQQNKRTRMNVRTQRRGQDIAHEDRQAAAKRGEKRTAANRPRSGVGSLTQGEENKIKDTVTQVLSIITDPPKFEDPPKGSEPGAKGPKLTRGRLLAHLRNGTNPLKKPIPDDIIQIAFELRDNNGVLSPKGVKLLHSRGMHVPREWLPKKRTEQYGPTGAILPGR